MSVTHQLVPVRGSRGERGAVLVTCAIGVARLAHGTRLHGSSGQTFTVHWPWYVRLWRWRRWS